MIRIIGGEFRHRHLAIPEVEGCRPTMDKVREAVFSSLGEKVIGSTFLDLFAGSGAVGIEALSRGAEKVIFNEKNPQVLRYLNTNVSEFDPDRKKTLVLRKDYSDCLRYLASRGFRFDVVYLDPPYEMNVNRDIATRMRDEGLLAEGAIVIFEEERDLEELDGFSLKAKRYGHKRIGFYTLK